MTLVQLEVFLAVVQQGGFTRAGVALSMTQSAVSHIVQSLETELGTALLIRDRKGVKLTEAGERVLVHARQILAHTNAIREELQELKGLGAATVRIGSFPSVSSQLLPKLMDDFQTRYPAVTLVHLDGTNQEVRHWIYTGAVHLGFVSLPDDEFHTVPLLQDEMVLLLPENHRLATRRSVPVEALRSEAFVMTKGGCEAFILKMLAPVHPDIRHEAKETSTILTMVKQGLGVTILPSLALSPQLEQISVLSLEPRQYRHLGLAVNPGADSSPAVAAFVSHAQEWIRKHGIKFTNNR
jgi:DNA-binding transcriptional LysR family regulator